MEQGLKQVVAKAVLITMLLEGGEGGAGSPVKFLEAPHPALLFLLHCVITNMHACRFAIAYLVSNQTTHYYNYSVAKSAVILDQMFMVCVIVRIITYTIDKRQVRINKGNLK